MHLGWAVQVYNAAEALPNLINPFWMLPLLGVLGLRARESWASRSCSCSCHLPLVLFLLWALAFTLQYHPPVIAVIRDDCGQSVAPRSFLQIHGPSAICGGNRWRHHSKTSPGDEAVGDLASVDRLTSID